MFHENSSWTREKKKRPAVETWTQRDPEISRSPPRDTYLSRSCWQIINHTPWKMNGWNLKITCLSCLKRNIIWTKPSFLGSRMSIFRGVAKLSWLLILVIGWKGDFDWNEIRRCVHRNTWNTAIILPVFWMDHRLVLKRVSGISDSLSARI